MKHAYFIVLIGLAILTGCSQGTQENSVTGNVVVSEPAKPRIGFCPTMLPYALAINENDEFELVSLGSSSEALLELKESRIDLALIGRKAKTHEVLQEIKEIRLMEGYTLITETQRTITKEELRGIEIHTHVDAETTGMMFGEEQKIVFHETLEEAKSQGIEKAVLINWNEYNDYELLVIYDGPRKDLRFRAPRIYHY